MIPSPSGGLTWIALTTVASGGAAPSSGASWQPYNFEIWASNGSMSSSLKIYIKLVYGNSTTAFAPQVHNLRMCPWRNGVAQGWTASAMGPGVLVIDRAKTATGADADGYAYIGWLTCTNTTTAAALSAIILKSSVGGIVAQTTSPMWSGTLATPTGSLNNWGSSPAMPIMPLVGYTANPLLGAITIQAVDSQNGAVIPVWLYGAPHKFLVCGSDTTFVGYRAVNGTTNTAIPAILWE